MRHVMPVGTIYSQAAGSQGFWLLQLAVAETNALQQQRQAEYLAEQLKQREAELQAKHQELEREVLGRKLAESQHARAEDAARQDAERAERALQVPVLDMPWPSTLGHFSQRACGDFTLVLLLQIAGGKRAGVGLKPACKPWLHSTCNHMYMTHSPEMQGELMPPWRDSAAEVILCCSFQECRSLAEREVTRARRALSTATGEVDAVRQREQQLMADLASERSITKDLQANLRRASASEQAGLLS